MGCPCPINAFGIRCGQNPFCPEHGDAAMIPGRYEYTEPDKVFLKAGHFGVLTREELDEIEAVRQADENRFRR